MSGEWGEGAADVVCCCLAAMYLQRLLLLLLRALERVLLLTHPI